METTFFDPTLFQLSSAQWWALAPYLWLCFGVFISTIFAGYRGGRPLGRIIATIIFGTFSYFQATHLGEVPQTLFASSLEIDSTTRIVAALVSFFALITANFAGASDKQEEHSEWLPLLMISVLGASLLPAARDFVSFFVYLETFAICGYIMTSLDTGRHQSLEAALKYLMMGAFASALLLMGATLLYGMTGSFDFEKISLVIKQSAESEKHFFMLAGALVVSALMFKVALVPFHMWSPDVYQGGPTGVAAFLAAATKLSIFSASAILLSKTSIGSLESIQFILFGLASLSIVIGSILAIAQTHLKRMLAYSGVVNAGYAAMALASGPQSTGSMLTNLAIYGAVLIALFALIDNFALHIKKSRHSDLDFVELGKASQISHPIILAIFSIGIFSLAGIPPLPGFFGKYLMLKDIWASGFYLGVYIMLIGTLLGLAYYLRVFVPIYMATQDTIESTKRVRSEFNIMTISAVLAVVFAVMMLSGLNRFPMWIQIGEVLLR